MFESFYKTYDLFLSIEMIKYNNIIFKYNNDAAGENGEFCYFMFCFCFYFIFIFLLVNFLL